MTPKFRTKSQGSPGSSSSSNNQQQQQKVDNENGRGKFFPGNATVESDDDDYFLPKDSNSMGSNSNSDSNSNSNSNSNSDSYSDEEDISINSSNDNSNGNHNNNSQRVYRDVEARLKQQNLTSLSMYKRADDVDIISASKIMYDSDDEVDERGKHKQGRFKKGRGKGRGRGRGGKNKNGPGVDSEYDDDDDDDETSSRDSGGNSSIFSKSRRQHRRDKRLLDLSKRSIFLFLLLVTIACALTTFFLTSRAEDDVMTKQFNSFATEISRVSEINVANVYSAISSMSLTISSYAQDTGAQWPFVTVPHFELRSLPLVNLSGAGYLNLGVLVTEANKEEWHEFSVAQQGWIQEGLNEQGNGESARPIIPFIHKRDDNDNDNTNNNNNNIIENSIPDEGPVEDYYAVFWQKAPAQTDSTVVNFNSKSTRFGELVDRMQETREGVLSGILSKENDRFDDTLLLDSVQDQWATNPQSYLVQPIFEDVSGVDGTSDIVAYLTALLPWDNYFRNIVPPQTAPLHLVLSNTCGQTMTYEIDGPDVILLSATQDLHDTEYNYLRKTTHMNIQQQRPGDQKDCDNSRMDMENMDGCNDGNVLTHSAETHNMLVGEDLFYCWYKFDIYPTTEFVEANTSNEPIYITLGVLTIFLVTSLVFFGYDMLVTKRQRRVEQLASKSNAIVSSLFPEQVRRRLMEEAEAAEALKNESKKKKREIDEKDLFGSGRRTGVDVSAEAAELDGGKGRAALLLQTKPIADLFPNATVLFGDICGFTAWSSTREPTQVFTLLEQIYNAFDTIAKRRRIFKVETIGDCYVAAAGLPDPRPDHALAMARFANECLIKVHSVVRKLEVRLGPGTGDLSMRFGLHSGPVTAGVLRGEKSRFQLFGDTVNTASRIESTGERGRIHISSETAELLRIAGKQAWVEKREGTVTAKGKGELETYWLLLNTGQNGIDSSTSSYGGYSSTSSISYHGSDSFGNEDAVASDITSMNEAPKKSLAELQDAEAKAREERLIQWNVDVMTRFLQKIEAKRQSSAESLQSKQVSSEDIANLHNGDVLSEVQEVIELPQTETVYHIDPTDVILDSVVLKQLSDYVSMICELYQQNSFHNFEHASHVTQSVSKLLSRIVTEDDIHYDDIQEKKKKSKQLHQYTFGITSDPITQFACAFSALIHDVDHTGVPNAVLVKEDDPVAQAYANKSPAEQHSVDLAWDMLMEPQFAELRAAIYQDDDELKRFRQLVVNSVMATDIADKELAATRKARWNKAFAMQRNSNATLDQLAIDVNNRKATIVIEHLIQASDVSHTMQHWHVYLKWNEKLFHEMYKAFLDGRLESDPSKGWAKGEIGFFDFYIIPLAKKLKDCGVFGVSSDEYLNYAEANRGEWEKKGEKVVAGYMKKYQDKQK